MTGLRADVKIGAGEFRPSPLCAGALHLARSGLSCAEAVLVAYGPQFGLSRGMAMKLAGGLGGGMTLSGEVCGALSAAVLVVGLACGAEDPADSHARSNTYLASAEFMERFLQARGSLRCDELCAGHTGTGQAFACQRLARAYDSDRRQRLGPYSARLVCIRRSGRSGPEPGGRVTNKTAGR